MQRRQLLRYGGVALAGLGTGGALVSQSNNANASLTMQSLGVQGAEASTTDGQIRAVKLSVSGSWSYDLPSGKQPETWTVELLVTDGKKVAKIDQHGGAARYLQNNGSYSLSGVVTGTVLFDASDFAATPDGATASKTVGVVVRLTVVNESGAVIASAKKEDSGEISVTNEAYNASDYGGVSGSGSFTVTE